MELPATTNVPLMKSLLVMVLISNAFYPTSGKFTGVEPENPAFGRRAEWLLQTGGL